MGKKTKNQRPLKKYKKVKMLESLPLKSLFFSSVAIASLTISLVFWGIKFLPPEIPVFYGKPISQERLAQSGMLALPAFSALTLSVFNLVLALLLKNNYFKKVLAVTSVTITLFAVVTTFKIFFLVGSI